jgi:2,3-bisphosphoglycerate-independent phosphoglycerate mutase
MSSGGVHSHQAHIAALAKLLGEAGLNVHVHAFLDGRDTPPQSAQGYITEFRKHCSQSISTLSGRYYAMDRDKRWDRVQKAYDVLVAGGGSRYDDPKTAIQRSYDANVSDEFLLPVSAEAYSGMHEFKGFERSKRIKFSAALGMNEYSKDLAPLMQALFTPQPLTHILGEIVSQAGMKQLRIAETEKYAHVTFFFNGGREQEFPGEERILVPSPKVATYDLQPEMSAFEVTDKLLAAIAADTFDLIVVNYANTDMVGHTGNIEAARKAVETVDKCLGKLHDAVMAKGGAMLITADHGNAEQMFDEYTHQSHTAHTMNLVPAILVSKDLKGKKLAIPEGKLGDVAPTILQMLKLPQPKEMTGTSLLANYA